MKMKKFTAIVDGRESAMHSSLTSTHMLHKIAHRWVDVKFYRNQATGFLGIEVDKYIALLVGLHDGLLAVVLPFSFAVALLSATGWLLVNRTDLLHYEVERIAKLNPVLMRIHESTRRRIS